MIVGATASIEFAWSKRVPLPTLDEQLAIPKTLTFAPLARTCRAFPQTLLIDRSARWRALPLKIASTKFPSLTLIPARITPDRRRDTSRCFIQNSLGQSAEFIEGRNSRREVKAGQVLA